MNRLIEESRQRVLAGDTLSRAEAILLYSAPLDELCAAADEIRAQRCGDLFDLCTIVNGKSGRCSEDCKYCAQSVHYRTAAEEYPLLGGAELCAHARDSFRRGVPRYSIVASGRALGGAELARLCESIRRIRAEVGVEVCVSLGLLGEAEFALLRAAGVSRVHCNLETSRRFFPSVCTTHSYDDKLATLRAARRAGMSICSGGIIGLGELAADRIDLALTLRELGVRSVPVNFLNPIPGTPFEHNIPLTDDEKRRVVAVFRFLLPDASIRLAGGRGLIADRGAGCFRAGANAAITGDMLTTAGITVETDLSLLREMGYRPGLRHE